MPPPRFHDIMRYPAFSFIGILRRDAVPISFVSADMTSLSAPDGSMYLDMNPVSAWTVA